MAAELMDGVRPFDWVMLSVEILVLVLIAAEVVPALIHKWKARKRQKVLFSLLGEGQEILNHPPTPFKEAAVPSWGQSVDAWSDEVTNVLSRYSEQAVASFNHQSEVGASHKHVAV